MKILFFAILLFSFSNSYSQRITLTGQVLSGSNNPIELAIISVVGQNIEDTSDDLGVFHLSLPSNIKKGDLLTLRISKPGYLTLTRKIAVSFLSIPIRLTKRHTNKRHISSNSIVKTNIPPLVVQQNFPTTVSSYNQSGGITAGQINIAPLARKLDNNNSMQLIKILPDKNEKIVVNALMGDSEAFQFATEMFKFLKTNGYKNLNIMQALYSKPIFGEFFIRDTSGMTITIGSRQ